MTALAISVPAAGRQFYGLGRDASYAAAERGDIPTIRVGRTLRVPVAAVLKQQGVSDDVIERLLRDALSPTPQTLQRVGVSADTGQAAGADSKAGSPSHEPALNDVPAEGVTHQHGHRTPPESSVRRLHGL